jgi:hypothetical protein
MRSTIQGNTNVVKGIAILILAILISLFTVFLATGLSNKTSATGRSGEQLIGEKSPDFLAAVIDGDSVSLSNYLGSPSITAARKSGDFSPINCSPLLPVAEVLLERPVARNTVNSDISMANIRMAIPFTTLVLP